MRSIGSLLPETFKTSLKSTRDRVGSVVMAIPYHGKERYCPVCGKSSLRFRPFGSPPREDAQCIHCRALERHRFLWHYLDTKTNLFDGAHKKMLHVAPEACFSSILKKLLGSNYLTADLLNPKVMVKMDITDIEYPDESFDIIFCNHVLEHVGDDKRAMRELFRVLKSDGWAILLVPITAETTFEDPSIVTPEERIRAFGQADHVRRYGPDYIERLRDAGFSVEVFKANDLVKNDEAIRLGIAAGAGEIYCCTK